MKKRLWILALVLLFFILAHCRLLCSVSIDGEKLAALYPLSRVYKAERAAVELCEEIAEKGAQLPALGKRYVLSLRQGEGRLSELFEKIVAASPDVSLVTLVKADGQRLGLVESGAILLERLHEAIWSAAPQGAVDAVLSGRLEFEKLYSRREWMQSYEEMLNGIFQAAPVIYLWERDSTK